MPFDFLKLQPYSINYEILFNELKSAPILSSQNLKEQYLDIWKEALIESDKIVEEAFNTPVKVRKLQNRVLNKNETEIFQDTFYFGASHVKVYFHYRVSAIVNCLMNINYNLQIEKLPLEEFSKPNSSIQWSEVPIDQSLGFNDSPIILAPFYNHPYRYVVIDGNHRLSHAKKLKKHSIDCIFLAEQTLIENNFFTTIFDKLIYIFYNELNHLANEKLIKQTPDDILLKKSFLNDNNFHF